MDTQPREEIRVPEAESSGVARVRGYWLIAAAIAILPLVLTAPAKHFTADDYWFAGYGNIPGDPSVCSLGRAFVGDWLSGFQGKGGWLRPLPRILFWLNDKAFGLGNPWGYHLTNALLHAGCAALVAVLAERLLRGHRRRATGGSPAALAAGLLFALTPQATGAASWISGRTDLLALFFLLSALVSATASGKILLRSSAVFLFTVLSIFSKESGYFTAPAVVVITAAWWWSLRRDDAPARLREAALPPFLATGVASFIMLVWRFLALGGMGGYPDQFGGKDASDLLGWWAEYLQVSLHLERWLIVPLAALVLAGVSRRHLPAFCAGVLLWVVAAFPVMGLPLIPVENDRFLYFSAAGFALAGGALVAGALHRGRTTTISATAAALLILAFFAHDFVRRDLLWTRASAICRDLMGSIVEKADRNRDSKMVMVFRNMDFISYEHDTLQQFHGAKILPWHQAKWALWRESRGRHIGEWGYSEDLLTSATMLAYIDEEKGDYSVRFFRAGPARFGDAKTSGSLHMLTVPPAEWRDSSESLSEYFFARPQDRYLFAQVTLQATVGHLPAMQADGDLVHTNIPASPAAVTSHPFNLGLLREEGGGWSYDPDAAPGGSEVRKIVVAVFPLVEE
jgi:hypothetical protein